MSVQGTPRPNLVTHKKIIRQAVKTDSTKTDNSVYLFLFIRLKKCSINKVKKKGATETFIKIDKPDITPKKKYLIKSP
jgi:hypothetical protein